MTTRPSEKKKSTSSSEEPPVGPSPSLGNAVDSATPMVGWRLHMRKLLGANVPDGSSGRMYPASCRRTKGGTLVPFLGRWRNAGIVSRTECWTLGTSEFPSGVEEFSLLDISAVLETIVSSKYYLTP